MKKALVCGAGGFIGSHLSKKLKEENCWVRGVDLKYPDFASTEADDFVIGDLRDPYICRQILDQRFDEVYQLAADMGGAGYVFTGNNDADIMHNSAMINLNILEACCKRNTKNIFIPPQHVYIRNTTNWIRITQTALKIALTRPNRTVNTGGKNFLVSVCTYPITGILAWR